jgi:hypothetical protein
MYFKGREDAQTWKDRLIGKRIVCADRHVADHEGWKSTDPQDFEPRVFYSAPLNTTAAGISRQYNIQTASPLLKLPAEIRNRILELVLPPHMTSQAHTEGPSFGDATWMNTSAIIFCCRQLYVEGRGMAVDLHTFEWEQLPKQTRLCAAGKAKSAYDYKV